jgi:hypothetical protein|tara:strand:+ start:261 stop:542 length:282 start_codon:yes stop_codon:yes gene_type:complete
MIKEGNSLPAFDFEKLGVYTGKVYDKKPKFCSHCGFDRVGGIEVLGACNDSLLWECCCCGLRMLKFSKERTLDYLNKARDVFFDKGGKRRYYA